MLINAQTRYAVMALVYMAAQGAEGAITLRSIAKELGLDLSYLEQIFSKLKKAGVVDAKKGRGGGYVLKIAPNLISLEGILQAFDHNFRMTSCHNPNVSACKVKGVKCNSHDLWKYLGARVITLFQEISIADVIAGQYPHLKQHPQNTSVVQ